MISVQEAQGGSSSAILTLGGRVKRGTTITMLVALALGSGLFFGLDWLVALGVSGLVLSLLPCLAMCALGVCASRMDKKDRS